MGVRSKKFRILAFLCIVFAIGFTSIHREESRAIQPAHPERKIQEQVLRQIITFRDFVKDTFFTDAEKKIVDIHRVREDFLTSRILFKSFEWAAAYFAADLTERLNGPPVEEIENADLLDPALARGTPPMGLQVIEQSIYPDIEGAEALSIQIGHLITNTDYLISYFKDHQLSDWRILDAAKLEVFRIITLGITGYDNALSLNSIQESAAALSSLEDVLSYYKAKNGKTSLLKDLNAAVAYLQHNNDFTSFDRAEFITRYANKITEEIAALEQTLSGPKVTYNRMLKQDVKTLFDANAFNVDAFSPGPEFHITADKINAGKKLFYDPLLSGTGTRSCASCHRPDLAFTDGLTKQTDIHNPVSFLKRNVPTLLNAALQSNYFYDMRSLTLEDQTRDVIGNQSEMGGSMDSIIRYVSTNEFYTALFAKAFPAKNKNEISADEVTGALAAYVRSLTKLDSRFDHYMRGNKNALSEQELKGFNLFMGKAKCATCHFIPLFNGVTPPKYIRSEAEVLGVPLSLTDSTLDPDPGYYGVIGVNSCKYAFKIPTIRNINKTAPYMHNGVYQSLDQVMEFYNNGGGAGLKINLPNQTLSSEHLNLSEEEKTNIIAFMNSLEDKGY